MAKTLGTRGNHTKNSNSASYSSLYDALAQTCVDAPQSKFQRLVSVATVVILAPLVVGAVVLFSIVEAIIPFTHQTTKEILTSPFVYLKLLAIFAVGLALLAE
jgi:hypothetical protein